MKFVCSGTELSEGLKRVGGALPTRTVNQVLEGVKIVTLIAACG
jgi:DNA polymerase III sliding clamp (beta) subunit (PCNA family)